MNPSMNVIVTGGAGFIGSALVRRLLADGCRVLVVDALTYAGHRSTLADVVTHPSFSFAHLNVCDAAGIAAALASFRPDAIAHLAAETHVDRSITGADVFVQTNLVGSFTVLEAARRYWAGLTGQAKARFRLLHMSTDEVFGALGPRDPPFAEESPYAPRSPYAASKAGADHLAESFAHTHGLPVILAHCGNNFGPYQLPEKLIPLMILNALEAAPLPLYGAGDQVRDWLFVDEHAAALTALLHHARPGARYCIGGRAQRTNRAVVEAICTLLDAHRPHAAPHARLITPVPDRPGHDHRYAINPARIEQEIGWRARTGFEDALAQTVAWYLAHEDWWGPLRAAGHGRGRLGLPANTASN
jgi:dTDP-glucose 4,6-dehydratase